MSQKSEAKDMQKIHGGNIWRIAKENGIKPQDIIDFSASINPLGLSPRAEKAIKDAIFFVGHYPEPEAEAMRRELAIFHNLPEENILVGNGSTEFIYLLPQIFRPKKAIIVEPAFSEYRNSLEIVGCKAAGFLASEDKDFIPDIGKLCSIIEKGCDLVYLCNPANPTGALLARKDVMKIAEECRRYNAILAVDEAFMDFVEQESVKRDAMLLDNLVVIRSMTKFFSMAGLRLGYIIANKGFIKRFEEFKPPWSVNTLAILAGIESLHDADYIERTKDWLRNERPFLLQGMDALSFLKTYPTQVNYILVKILMDGILAKDIQKDFLKTGILIRDCSSFIGLDQRFFRVAVRKGDENRSLLHCLNTIVTSLR